MTQPEPAVADAFEALVDEHRLAAHSAAAALVLAIAACTGARGDRRVLLPVGHDLARPFDLRTMIAMGGGEPVPIGRVDRLAAEDLVPAAALVLCGGVPLLAPPAAAELLLPARREGLPSVVVAPAGEPADRWLDAGASLVVTGDGAAGVLWGEPTLVERARRAPHAAALAPA